MEISSLKGHEKDVWVSVCVDLHQPAFDSDGSTQRPMTGYIRNFGLRVAGPQPKEFIQRLITDGAIDWGNTEAHEIEIESLDDDIKALMQPVDEHGVWYSSGRIYFSEDKGSNA